jgi:hypothetical protein
MCSRFSNLQKRRSEMRGEHRPWQRYCEAFWLAHHEAWKNSDLNQSEYCEAQGIPLKVLAGKFKAEPQPTERKLLYRRGGVSHILSHSLSHPLSHVTYSSSSVPVPVAVRPMRGGYRRRFSEADKRRILEGAARPGASLTQIARRYGIARPVLCRWKQELTPVFVAMQITDAAAKSGAVPTTEERMS